MKFEGFVVKVFFFSNHTFFTLLRLSLEYISATGFYTHKWALIFLSFLLFLKVPGIWLQALP